MTYEQAVQLGREIHDYWRRLQLMAVGTFGRESGEWGCSVRIDNNKERHKVLWSRDDLAEFAVDLVRLCDSCHEKRPLHVLECACGDQAASVVQRTFDPKAKVIEDRTPAGMLF